MVVARSGGLIDDFLVDQRNIESLALCGSSNLIGNYNNGNFLRLVKSLRKYDSVLNGHITRVRKDQVKRGSKNIISPMEYRTS